MVSQRFDPGNKVADGLVIGQIAFERGVAHQQVAAHQPADQLGFIGIHAKARAQLERDFGAEHRMVAAPALGNVMQQHSGVGGAAR